MTNDEMAPSNPFVSRCVRPGAIPYLFQSESNLDTLITSLRDHRWRGQIVGLHGSGKSTLVESLMAPLRRAGRKPVQYRFSSTRWQSSPAERLSATHAESAGYCLFPRGDDPVWDRNTQVIVDGFEQLYSLQRLSLYARCLYQGAGLLVTTHRRALTLPLLYHTHVDLTTAWDVVQRLFEEQAANPISNQEVSDCLQSHHGNMREMLFALYDLYETRRYG